MKKENLKSNPYQKILEEFVGEDELRPWMNKPFYIGDTAYSTNAATMVIMDKSKGVIADPLTDYKPESVKSVIPEINGLLTSYKTKDLIDRFDSIKLIPEVLLEDIEKECGECDGEGEVEWGYGNHIKYDTCPECYGQCVYEDTKEVVTGEMVKEEGLIKIGNSTFATSIIGKIVDFAKEVNSKTIKLVHQSHDRAASVLEIEGVRFLIMPNISENLELKIII